MADRQEIERFDPWQPNGRAVEMVACESGGYVRYSDHLAAKQAALAEVEEERDKSRKSHEFTKQWYAERIRRITDTAKREGIWEEIACILANGTASPGETPTYAQQLNSAKYRAAQAEAALQQLQERARAFSDGDREELGRIASRLMAAASRRGPSMDIEEDAEFLQSLANRTTAEQAVAEFVERLVAEVRRKEIQGDIPHMVVEAAIDHALNRARLREEAWR